MYTNNLHSVNINEFSLILGGSFTFYGRDQQPKQAKKDKLCGY